MYWELGFLRVFLCTIVSPYFIVKSLQLRGRRQTAKPHKYCLVRVIVFFGMCFLYLFLFLIGWDFWLNSLQGSHISLDGELKNHRITVSRILELSRNKYSTTKYLNKCLYSTGMGYNDYVNNYFLPKKFSTSHRYTPEQYASVLIIQYSHQIKVN